VLAEVPVTIDQLCAEVGAEILVPEAYAEERDARVQHAGRYRRMKCHRGILGRSRQYDAADVLAVVLPALFHVRVVVLVKHVIVIEGGQRPHYIIRSRSRLAGVSWSGKFYDENLPLLEHLVSDHFK